MSDSQAPISYILHQLRAVGGFTASVTQAQGNGVVDYGFTRVAAVGTNDDAVTLPTAVPDAYVTILNDDSTQQIQLWPSSGDRILPNANDIPITVTAQQRITLVAVNTRDWYRVYKTPDVSTSLTAFSGGGQTDATLLTSEWNRVSIVAANGDSVKLPTAEVGSVRSVYNNDSAQYCEVFPNSSDRINDQANDTSIILSPNAGVILQCFSTGLWHTFGFDLPTIGSVTASVTQSQGNGAISNGYTRIGSVGTNGDAITLPTPYIGNECTLLNSDGGQYAQVFPSSGTSITVATLALGADNPLLLFPGQTIVLRAISTTDWYCPPPTPPSVNSLAAVGNDISAAAQLIADRNVITASVTGSADAVKLPVAYIGRTCWIHNDDVADAVLVFPQASSTIDDLAPSASQSLAVNATIELRAISTTKWRSNIT